MIATVILLGFAAAASAFAAKSPHRYSPKHGAKCRKTYKRIKHHRKVFCVKTAAQKRGQSSLPTLHSHLDPSLTRNPRDPFQVTYGFSASATRKAISADLGAATKAAAPLPSGVVSLYSDGSLQCSVKVGGSATGGQCPVTYQALGEHTVETVYTSQGQSVTDTEIEQVGPLPTTTSLAATYANLPNGPIPWSDGHCTTNGPAEAEFETCEYREGWDLGSITITGGSDPAGEIQVYCAPGTWCPSILVNHLNLASWQQELVPLIAEATVNGDVGSLPQNPTCEEMKAFATSGSSPHDKWFYPTGVSLRAVPLASGYAPSEATTTVSFPVDLPC